MNIRNARVGTLGVAAGGTGRDVVGGLVAWGGGCAWGIG